MTFFFKIARNEDEHRNEPKRAARCVICVTSEEADRQTDGRIDEQMDKRMDEQMDQRMDEPDNNIFIEMTASQGPSRG